MKVKELLNRLVNEHSKHNYFVSPLAWCLTWNSLPFLNGFYRTFIITKKVKCFYCKANCFYSVSQQQLQNVNEKFNLSLTGKLPLFLCLAIATEIKTNEWTEMCGSRKYPYHPHRRDLPYGPPPSGFFQNQPPKSTPTPPLQNFQNFCTPPGNIAISSEVNKEVHVVLFARMPNFASFMYFLLNCITDRQIPYANSLCSQVTNKFCEFHVFSVEFYNR